MRALLSAFLVAAAVPSVRAAEARAPAPAVTARLSIPPAEINVIGDPVTLTWHFTNPTPRPLAFVWEACCRLNGRLVVSQDGRDLPRIPPGPASAHAFAKPAIILPGRENGFESMLADWVFIQRGVSDCSGPTPPEPSASGPSCFSSWRSRWRPASARCSPIPHPCFPPRRNRS